MKPPNPPSRHHYIPEFLIREWAGSDGEVERFVRLTSGDINVRRVPPKAIGFQEDLYRDNFASDPWRAQALETDFFSPLDNLAAKAMQALVQGEQISDSDVRSAWATFLISLFHRSPKDLHATKLAVAESLALEDPEIEARYREIRNSENPETFVEYINKFDKKLWERISLSVVSGLILNEDLGTFLINCHWQVFNLNFSRF